MNPSVLFVFFLSILLGVLRAADLAFGTDAVTGLCVVGSVWWRYLALGIVVLAAVLVGRTQPSRSEAVRSRRPLAGILAFVGAVCFLAAAGAQIALGAASGLGGFVRCILECLCSAWLSTMGRCWLSPNEWKKPFGGLYLAVAGSLLFYWNVLLRFMENSSSWHRVTPTAAVWQALAALVFLAALARALHVPQPGNGIFRGAAAAIQQQFETGGAVLLDEFVRILGSLDLQHPDPRGDHFVEEVDGA